MNTELISGTGPDIIDLEAFPGKELYAAAGALYNLAPYFDEELNSADFFALDVLMEDGQLYYVPACFGIMTHYGLSSSFDGMTGWTLNEYSQYMMAQRQKPDAVEAGSKIGFLKDLCVWLIPMCLDWETGTCSFTSDVFIEALLLADEIDERPWSTTELPDALMGGGQLLESGYLLTSPIQIAELEKSVGQELTFIGSPTATGQGGSYLYLSALAGINANSPQREAAWDFLKFIMTDEDVQKQLSSNMLPILRSVEMERLHSLTAVYPEYEGMEITVNDDGTFSVDGVQQDRLYNPTPILTKAQAEKYLSLIDSATCIYDYDKIVYEIIEQEADALFNGQASAEEAAALIQSRVSLYMAEQR